jgi:hypothetical protein
MKTANILISAIGLAVFVPASMMSKGEASAPLTHWQKAMSQEPVQLTYFGMHMHHASSGTPWPGIPFGTWRLWDSFTSWKDLEPAKGQWDFARLDALINLATEHHEQVILTLAMTPQWASSRPYETCIYTPGSAAPPASMKDWEDYVNTVTRRYKGRIAYYEMWNEVDLKGFWSGTDAELLVMQQSAYSIIKKNDPNAQLIAASITAGYGLPFLERLLKLGYANSADIIGYHFYVSPSGPEAIGTLASRVEALLTKYGVDKPLWNTETGWHPPANYFPNEDAMAGVVVRALLIARSAGISRFLWYCWDNHGWVNLFMTEDDNKTLTKAALAYANLEKWLIGNKLNPCTESGSGLWSCTVNSADGQESEIVWSPNSIQTVHLDSNNVTIEDMYGKKSKVTEESVKVGAFPMLIHKPTTRSITK